MTLYATIPSQQWYEQSLGREVELNGSVQMQTRQGNTKSVTRWSEFEGTQVHAYLQPVVTVDTQGTATQMIDCQFRTRLCLRSSPNSIDIKTIDPETGQVQLEAVPAGVSKMIDFKLHGQLQSGAALMGMITQDRWESMSKVGKEVPWPISMLAEEHQVEWLPSYFENEQFLTLWVVTVEELP